MGKIKNNIPSQEIPVAPKNPPWIKIILTTLGVFIGLLVLTVGGFRRYYANRVYPNVSVGGISFGGKTQPEVSSFWAQKNEPFADAQFELKFESTIATISGSDIELGYDADLSAAQAYLVGRSGKWLSDLYVTFFQKSINLSPYFRWKQEVLADKLAQLSGVIDIPVSDGLFSFENGKVTAFKPSSDGRSLNKEEALKRIQEGFQTVANTSQQRVTINLPVEIIKPSISTSNTNAFGLKELIGTGYSEFAGSIPGRIHNVALAASRLNGVLIKPGEDFSFNNAIGDISAATGYQSAYIIKEGRTVLGDGGGVCQVSSTLFRAALNAGLPITERQAHAYRVHYYEDGGFKPGLDATVFSPSVDLRIKNDTANYILIQTKTDTKNLTLTFELYGTKDGRVSQILNHTVGSLTPAPPPLYQDDPTLAPGVVKQVDWAATGAKASFQYKVTKNGETLQDTTFYSNYRPWQAVYLRGPNTP
jgi:vancomycin resistance protein YoaR